MVIGKYKDIQSSRDIECKYHSFLIELGFYSSSTPKAQSTKHNLRERQFLTFLTTSTQSLINFPKACLRSSNPQASICPAICTCHSSVAQKIAGDAEKEFASNQPWNLMSRHVSSCQKKNDAAYHANARAARRSCSVHQPWQLNGPYVSINWGFAMVN